MYGGLCSPWAVDGDLPPSTARPGLPEGTTWDELLLRASELLDGLTGHRWTGTCTSTVVVTARERTDPVGPLGWHRSWGWCSCTSLGSCCARDLVLLPDGPVTRVESVTVGATALSPDAYEVIDGAYLRRLDGGRWATCSTDTVVVYEHGTIPPASATAAAAALAVELGKAAAGDDSCSLPKQVTQIARQGTTMSLVPASAILRDGMTGVYAVDVFLASANRPAPPGAWVWSPDLDTYDVRRRQEQTP